MSFYWDNMDYVSVLDTILLNDIYVNLRTGIRQEEKPEIKSKYSYENPDSLEEIWWKTPYGDDSVSHVKVVDKYGSTIINSELDPAYQLYNINNYQFLQFPTMLEKGWITKIYNTKTKKISKEMPYYIFPIEDKNVKYLNGEYYFLCCFENATINGNLCNICIDEDGIFMENFKY